MVVDPVDHCDDKAKNPMTNSEPDQRLGKHHKRAHAHRHRPLLGSGPNLNGARFVSVLGGSLRAQDAAIAGAVSVFAVVALVTDFGEGGSDATGLSYLLVALAGVALLWRRQQPLAVLSAVVILRIGLTWESANDLALAPAAMVALFTAARAGQRRTNVAITVGVALLMAVVVAALGTDAFVPEALGEAALLLLPVAVGDAARSRAERLRDLIDTEADRRVSAERLRIARDLHDVVAHGLSTIAVQSGVAAHLLDRDPGQAKEALEVINATGKSSLEELRAMVGVLRSTDDAPLRPTPNDPNDLSDLVAGATNSGLEVEVSAVGQFPADVGDSCVVALHRIAQEALTNVARHAGPVTTRVSIRHSAHDVDLSIVNVAGTGTNSGLRSTGVGIVGMTERAEALGGTLTTQRLPDGGFQVSATIPYHHRSSLRDNS